MPAPVNRFKRALLDGQLQIGCWGGMADAYATEMVAGAGFDWVVIDGEHAPNDLRSTMAQLQAVQASASQAVVRVPHGDTALIKQVLDIGAQTVVVPMVDSGAQAAQLVRAMRYPPEGVRGVGAALARASNFNAIPDYVTTANAETCLVVQVESQAGLDALDDIAATDGVDGVFIGPADLAADMGYLGNSDEPSVQAAIADGLQRIRAHGKGAGILCTERDFALRSIEQGATFVAVGVDVLVFVNALRELADSFKPSA